MESFHLDMSKMTACSVCKAQISKSAKACPHCGATRTTVSDQLKSFGNTMLALGCLLIVLLVALAAVLGRGCPSRTHSGRRGPALSEDRAPTEPAGAEPAFPATASAPEQARADTEIMGATAPRNESRPTPGSTPAESPEHYRDLALAESYAEAAAQQGGFPSVSWGRGSIGYLQGRYELVQIVSPSSGLMGKLDRYGLADERFLLEGIGTRGLTDGAHVDLGNQLVLCNGTASYVTVLGAQATVFSFKAVEPAVLILAAQEEGTRIGADLARLAESPIGRAVEAQRKLRMYEAGAKHSEWAAAQAAAVKAEMERLPVASDEDVASFDQEKQVLQRRLEHARAMADWLEFK